MVGAQSHVDAEGTLCLELSGPTPDTLMAQCPLCPEAVGLQPIGNFGICRARKSGRNLYCKACIRKKVSDSRAALREYRNARREMRAQGKLPLIQGLTRRRNEDNVLLGDEIRNPSFQPAERVLGAIHAGARTYKAIIKESRLHSDVVGNALAELILNRPRLVESRMILDEGSGSWERHYFPIAPALTPTQPETVSSSLSQLGGIVAPIMKGHAA